MRYIESCNGIREVSGPFQGRFKGLKRFLWRGLASLSAFGAFDMDYGERFRSISILCSASEAPGYPPKTPRDSLIPPEIPLNVLEFSRYPLKSLNRS